jgi:hypothetical protein
VTLNKGKYVLATFHQWFISNHGKYFVFLSSERSISLKKGGLVDNGFLLKTLTNFEERMAKQEADSNKLYKMRI